MPAALEGFHHPIEAEAAGPLAGRELPEGTQEPAHELLRGHEHEGVLDAPALIVDEKPEILKAYLDAYKGQVQRFFPLPAGSPVEAFRSLTARYPAFELRAQP